MSYSRIIFATFLAILSVCSVNAQNNQPQSCQSLTGLPQINASLLAGDWYEVYRAPAANVSCVHAKVNLNNNQTQLNVTTIYSASQTGFLMNQFALATIDVSAVNANNGFSVKYNNTNTTATIKILSAVYNSSIALCGYTDPNDVSTSFALIAMRQQMANRTMVMQLKDTATQSVSLFNSSLAANITQSLQCKTNSATSLVPAFATFLAAFYAILKLV